MPVPADEPSWSAIVPTLDPYRETFRVPAAIRCTSATAAKLRPRARPPQCALPLSLNGRSRRDGRAYAWVQATGPSALPRCRFSGVGHRSLLGEPGAGAPGTDAGQAPTVVASTGESRMRAVGRGDATNRLLGSVRSSSCDGAARRVGSGRRCRVWRRHGRDDPRLCAPTPPVARRSGGWTGHRRRG